MFCSTANPGFLSNIFINSLPLSSILLHYKMQIEWCLDPTLQRRTLLLFLTSIPLCVTSVPTQLTSGSSPSLLIYSRPRFLPAFIVSWCLSSLFFPLTFFFSSADPLCHIHSIIFSPDLPFYLSIIPHLMRLCFKSFFPYHCFTNRTRSNWIWLRKQTFVGFSALSRHVPFRSRLYVSVCVCVFVRLYSLQMS